MITVRDIVKNDRVYTIEPDATMQAAIHIMSSEKIGALPVVEHGRLVGIISERDYVQKIASQKIPAWSVKIHEIMTCNVITVGLDDSVKHCMELMISNHIRHLPVMDKDQLTKIISITDVLLAVHSSSSTTESEVQD